jgi:hypothetical protein
LVLRGSDLHPCLPFLSYKLMVNPACGGFALAQIADRWRCMPGSRAKAGFRRGDLLALAGKRCFYLRHVRFRLGKVRTEILSSASRDVPKEEGEEGRQDPSRHRRHAPYLPTIHHEFAQSKRSRLV